jgi:hypothetical protein
MAEVRFPAGQIYSLCQKVQTGLRPNQPHNRWETKTKKRDSEGLTHMKVSGKETNPKYPWTHV